ncbi:MAG: acyltransferase [Actinomycetes bacterium]
MERRRFPLFDGLRALAATLVFVFHSWAFVNAGDFAAFVESHSVLGSAWANGADRLGVLGVALFYVISAFLLYRPFVAARLAGHDGPDLRRYALRRAARIVPAYWLALTVVCLIEGRSDVLSLRGIFQTYLFGGIYDGHALWFNNPLPAAWTIAVEVTFYIFLPFWAALVGAACARSRDPVRRELSMLVGLAAVGFGWKLVVIATSSTENTIQPLTVALPASLDVFAAGMGMAVLSAAKPEWARRPADLLARRSGALWLGALLVYGAMCWLAAATGPTGEDWRSKVMILGVMKVIVATALVLPAVVRSDEGGAPRRFLRFRPVVWVGLVSYGLYLWQVPVLKRIVEIDGFSKPPIAEFPFISLLALAITLVIAAASWYLLERRVLAWANSRFRSRVRH